MKIAKSAKNPNFKPEGTRELPPLPLVPEERDYSDKDYTKTGSFKLFTNPSDTASPKYSFSMPYIDGTQPLREVLQWVTNIKKVFAGLDITTGAAAAALVENVCQGSIKTTFKQQILVEQALHHEQRKHAARDACVFQDAAHI